MDNVIEERNAKRYFNCLPRLYFLTPCSRNLIDYLCEMMNTKNIASTSDGSRRLFKAFVLEACHGRIVYTDKVIKEAIKELEHYGLIIPMSIARVRINPIYFYSGGIKARITLIEELNLNK